MNFDLSKFKKINEDKKSAVLQHPEGHQIKIAKHVLSPKLRSQIAELPMHKAEGGEINAKSEGMAEERNRTSDPNFQMQFPEAKAGGSETQQAAAPGQQPIINVNVGGQPQQAQPAVQQQAAPSQGVPLPYQNPNYDPNAPWQSSGMSPMDTMKMQSPDTSVDERMAIDQKMQAQQADNNKRMGDYVANIQAYNQYAQAHGLPQKAMPPGFQPGMAQAAVGEQAPDQAPQAPKGPNDPFGTQAYSDAYMQGLNQQTEGLTKQAEAEGQAGQQQADILGQNIQKREAVANQYLDNSQKIDHEISGFMQDYKNQHIDPKHYLNSMGTGQKISTAIGLILGGMGGGLMHQENPVLGYLNKRIADDIESQKVEMGKAPTLMEANFKRLGNMKDATQLTQLMQTEIVKDQIAQVAAKSQDPLVKARAGQAIGQLNMQAAPVKSQIAMRQAMMQGMQNGNMDPSMAIRMMVPEKQQEEAYKELKEAQEQVKARNNVVGAFEELNKTNTLGNRISSPIQSASQVKALRDLLSVELARAAAGRVNEYEFKAAQDQFPKVGDSAETVQKKQAYLMHFIETKMNHPILNSYGINFGTTKQVDRFGAGGNKKLQLGAPVLGGKQVQPQQPSINNVSR